MDVAPFIFAGLAFSALGSSPPKSILPSQVHGLPDVDEHASLNVHSQRYSNRRHLATLDASNTAPLRLQLDFSALYENTAPKFSACFILGAWFRRGLPAQSTPPTSGDGDCDRGPNEWSMATQGCWGKCEARDLILAAGRAAMVAVVTSVASEFGNYFSVSPVDGALTFEVSRGRYVCRPAAAPLLQPPPLPPPTSCRRSRHPDSAPDAAAGM